NQGEKERRGKQPMVDAPGPQPGSASFQAHRTSVGFALQPLESVQQTANPCCSCITPARKMVISPPLSPRTCPRRCSGLVDILSCRGNIVSALSLKGQRCPQFVPKTESPKHPRLPS